MAYIYDLADTWNASGTTFTGIKLNVTNTASASGSRLIDLQVGGFPVFRVTANSGAEEIQLGNSTGRWVNVTGSYTKFMSVNSNLIGLSGNAPGVFVFDGGAFSFMDATGLNIDLYLRREAAGTLAQRNGTNAQAFNLYNTYTDASNYERGFMKWTSNQLQMGLENAGTGTPRSLKITAGSRVADIFLGATYNQIDVTTGHTAFSGRVSAASATLAYNAPTYGLGSCGISAAVSAPALYLHTPSFGWMGTGSTGTGFNGGLLLGFCTADPSNTSIDAAFARDAADTIAQRRGTNAQAFNIYNTYTDASNYERGFMRFVSNTLRIGTEKLGTGTARNLEFQLDGITRMSINTGGAVVANTAFYGATGSTYFGWTNNALMTSPSVGVIRLNNFAETDFNRLQFGGGTTSFPAIKRSTTSLQARLADDSAFTNIQGKLTTDTAYTAGAPTATGYIVLFDSTGTAYKVPAVAL